MSFVAKNYIKLKKHFFRSRPVDFTKTLRFYNNILIHPIMEPGREIFSLPAIDCIVKRKGEENVGLLINEKLRFFFDDIPARKIYYEDFSSVFSPNYKGLKNNLKGKVYDIYVELNRFDDDLLTLFALIPKSKIRICLDGHKENPIFNMVIATEEFHNEIERNNLILKPLGIKKIRKKIKWQKYSTQKTEKGKIGVAVYNHKICLKLFSLLKKGNFKPFLFVNDKKRVHQMQKYVGESVMPIYPLEKIFDVCSSCDSLITSINPILSMGFLQKKRMLVLLEKNERFYPSYSAHHLAVFSLKKGINPLFGRIEEFVKEK